MPIVCWLEISSIIFLIMHHDLSCYYNISLNNLPLLSTISHETEPFWFSEKGSDKRFCCKLEIWTQRRLSLDAIMRLAPQIVVGWKVPSMLQTHLAVCASYEWVQSQPVWSQQMLRIWSQAWGVFVVWSACGPAQLYCSYTSMSGWGWAHHRVSSDLAHRNGWLQNDWFDCHQSWRVLVFHGVPKRCEWRALLHLDLEICWTITKQCALYSLWRGKDTSTGLSLWYMSHRYSIYVSHAVCVD